MNQTATSEAMAGAPAEQSGGADLFVLPASFGQERLWFLDRLEPGGSVYNQPGAYRISGRLDRRALEASVNEIVRRHESLRTGFATEDGVVVQHVRPELPYSLPVQDLSAATDREAQLQRELAKEVSLPFDLSRAPLFRARLFVLAPEEHVLAVTFHHIVSDGWSQSVFFNELHAIYDALRQGRPSPLEELPIQYGDYAAWQREQLAGEELERQRTYWRRQLAGITAVDMPADRSRPKQQTYRGAQRRFSIPAALTAALKQVGLREKATLFVVTAAAFQALVHRYSGQTDIALGITTANRGRSELEGLIGFFANTLVLRTDLGGDPVFTDLLARVKDAVLGAFAHEDLPFEKMVEEAHVERDMSRSPLFQVLFNHAPHAATTHLGDLALLEVPVEAGISKFDLSVYLSEARGQLAGFIEYNTDLFDAATVERLIGHYQTMLQGIAANPYARISALPLLTAAETRQLLHAWNSTGADYPRSQTVAQLVEAQAARRPASIAVAHDGRTLSYHDLNAQADALAIHLRSLGVKPGTLVGICVERSLSMMVGLLATMKTGGAYVPLDPAFPSDRLSFMLEDSRASVLLTQTKLQGQLATDGVQVVLLDKLEQLATTGEKLPPSAGPTDLAYVLYTSGSTGKPKGVEISHGALTNFLWTMREAPGCSEDDVLLAVTTLSFDIAGLELYLPLICGARVELASRTVTADGRLLRDKLESLKPTMLQATPATWRMLIEAGWSGTSGLTALIGGEGLPADLAQQLLERVRALWNMYGPTETTIWSSVQQITDAAAEITIGRPIANTTFYILDSALQPVPVGTPGELFIGGDGLANGYRGRPELTAEKFIRHPFDANPDARLYRTGDLARYRANGQVVHLGRLDHQVKIRGFRIELGEIESALSAASGVAQCVVVARPDHTGAAALVAYVVPSAGTQMQAAELRGHLRQSLPDYMVPQYFVEMQALPLTPNGKVDRKQLPAPDRETATQSTALVAARTPVETQVAAIFADVLQVTAVGVNTDFFHAGGQSLTAIRLMSRLEAAFGIELPLQTIFESPTVAGISDRICDLTGAERAAPAQDGPVERRPPRSTTERQLVGVWQQVLGVPEVGINESFVTLQGKRDLVDPMLAEVRRVLGYRAEGIPLSGFHANPTIEGLARQIDGVAEPTTSLTVCLQPAGTKRPLFLIHAGGGYVFFYRALAARLGRSRPVYGVRAVTRADRSGPALEHSKNVEELAARYISEIRAVQPKGPYTLGGACFGGVIAFEMARQLRAHGEEIAGPVLLFDAFILDSQGGSALDTMGSGYAVNRAMQHFEKAAGLGRAQQAAYLFGKVVRNIPTGFALLGGVFRGLWHRVQKSDLSIDLMRMTAMKLKSTSMLEKVQQYVGERILDASIAMLLKYRPAVFPGKLVLLKAEKGDDPEPGWRRLAGGGLEVHAMNGLHLDMMEEPAVARTAAIVSAQLETVKD
jgi:amino acid adenylation domain-containing protein